MRSWLNSYLETSKLLFNIVRQVTKTLSVSRVQTPQLALNSTLLENLTNSHASSGSLVAIARPNALARSPDLTASESGLLQTIHDGVQIEADVGAITDEYPLVRILQSLALQRRELLEEAGDVDNGPGTNQVHASG